MFRILAQLTWFLVLVGCLSSNGRPPALVDAERRLSDSHELNKARAAAPHRVQEMLNYYQMAKDSLAAGNKDKSNHFATLANLSQDIALELANLHKAERRHAQAESRLATSTRATDKHEERGRLLSQDIGRAEKLLELKKELGTLTDKGGIKKRRLIKQIEVLTREQEKARRLQQDDRETYKLILDIKGLVQAAVVWRANGAANAEIDTAQETLFTAEQWAAQRNYMKAKRHALRAKASALRALEAAHRSGLPDHSTLSSDRQTLRAMAQQRDLPTREDEPRGISIVLRGLFPPGQATLLEPQHGVLTQVAQLARAFPKYPMLVEGFTDTEGRRLDNINLATERAQAVLDYLVLEEQVNVRRLQAVGYGDLRPLVAERHPDAREQNRRIEILFLIPNAATSAGR